MRRALAQPLDRMAVKKTDALYGQIFSRIRQWIREGQLQEGDPLPSERELAEEFGVSRVPVREAMKILEFLGAIQRIPGRGVFVKKIGVSNIVDSIDFMMLDTNHTLLDLFEAREGIEIQAAFLAAQRRTEVDLADLETAIQEMERKFRRGEDFAEASMSFHSAVLVASHNLAIVQINRFLADWLRYLRRQYLKGARTSEAGLHDHRAIAETIRLRDSAGASRAMQEHLARAKKVITDAVGEAR
jgi:GntR family transcriptional regulator, transcriptional repressor for pyruvate dehydrogenase complex